MRKEYVKVGVDIVLTEEEVIRTSMAINYEDFWSLPNTEEDNGLY